MAYYFMYTKRNKETKRDEHFKIDITKSKYFPVEPKYKNGGCTLQEIDLFTIQFNDESELRTALFKEGLLTMKDFNKPLSARHLRNDKYTKVSYGLFYQKDTIYIVDPNKLIQRIENKLYQGDYQFIIELTNVFDDPIRYREVSSTLPEVRNSAENSSRTGQISRHFYELDEFNDTLLVRMLKLLIYKRNRDRTINYGKINYPNFHKLLGFVNYYDKKLLIEQQKRENSYTEDNIFDMIENDTLESYTNNQQNDEIIAEENITEETKEDTSCKKRVLTRKKTPDYGYQMCLLYDPYKKENDYEFW